MPVTFKETDKQRQANKVIGSDATHCLLFGGSRCVSGDTILDGQPFTIRELAGIGLPVAVETSRGRQIASAPYYKGRCKLLRVELKSGRFIEVTPGHRFWSGRGWVFAEELSSNDSVAVLSSQRNLHASSLEPYPLESLEGVQRSTEIFEGLKERYSAYFRRYGQLPPPEGACGPTYRGQQFYAQGHTLNNLSRVSRVGQSHESNTRKGRPSKRGAADNQSGHKSCPRSSMGAFPFSYQPGVSLSLGSERIYGLFLGLRRKYQLFRQTFSLFLSKIPIIDNYAYRFFLFLNLSYDTPLSTGYELDNVLSVTQTSEKNYYCLSVPTTEQYFANGILNHNSGKTFKLVRTVIIRALAAPESRHAILRFRFNHVKAAIVHDTYPKVMRLCFPELSANNIDRTDWYAEFPNRSQIWFGGLDDKERTEKISGQEYATIYLNESSQIPYNSRNLAITRLAQKVSYKLGKKEGDLRLKMLYDCNPPSQAHWTYQLFEKKRDPDTKQPLKNPEDYASMVINPADNADNLPEGYMQTLENLPARMRIRFMDGVFSPVAEGALWTVEGIETWRTTSNLPDMQRVVVAVDPSGSDDEDNTDNDAIGIVVAGLGVDGNGYLLEDLTCKAGPATWGRVVAQAYERHKADAVVAEGNYGGAMVEHVIQTARKRTPFRKVTATRGKVVRAEPISALAEKGQIRHAGNFYDLEDELCAFTTRGYMGANSPNRADAYVWAFTDLFGAIVEGAQKPVKAFTPPRISAYAL